MAAEQTIGIRELKQRTSEIVRLVRDKGLAVQVTYRGQVVARLLPVHAPKKPAKGMGARWTDIDQLADEIGASWPGDVTATEAVREGRREL